MSISDLRKRKSARDKARVEALRAERGNRSAPPEAKSAEVYRALG